MDGLVSFLMYFGLSMAFAGLFLFIYGRVTPYREFNLISSGNVAASFSYGGALLGFAIPLASAIAHSVSLSDMALWAGVALCVQVLTFFFVRMMLPGIVSDIPNNQLSKGIFLGIVSIATGILNAACMTY